MAPQQLVESEELVPLNHGQSSSRRSSIESASSASTTSLMFDRIQDRASKNGKTTKGGYLSKDKYDEFEHEVEGRNKETELVVEEGPYLLPANRQPGKKARRLFWMSCAIFMGIWLLGLAIFISRKAYRHASSIPHDPSATSSRGSGKQVTLDQVMGGQWRATSHAFSWIEGANGEDGLLLEKGGEAGKDWLIVEDVRKQSKETAALAHDSITLMKLPTFMFDGRYVQADEVWPSKDLKHVLVLSERKSNWRHSYTGRYWIFNVESQRAQPLDPAHRDARIQLASWSPKSDAIVYTKDNNMFLRNLDSKNVIQITRDGGEEFFYGVPDWVYEEEVFQTNTATWWAEDGQYVAFLRTNESAVPEYPIQYFVSRPSGEKPPPGEASYPEVREIKYPKAGAPNPIVALLFYDVEKDQTFSVDIEGGFEDSDKLITEVIWAGSTGEVLVRETNRESDVMRVILIDVILRKGKVVREVDVTTIDGGWFEISQNTRYIPSDPSNGRPEDGYIDTIIYEGYDHLAYFTPMDNSKPLLLTSGKWEVVKAPSAVDLTNNLVYFLSTQRSSIERHVYGAKLDGSLIIPITDPNQEGFYGASFSKGAGYALLSYDGPNIPWQEVISTPSNPLSYNHTIETNPGLKQMAAQHELPIEIYSSVTIDGYTLNVVERRPPHFNSQKRYPVLFHLYGGPGSQTVDKKWSVDFQSFVAANLGYIVVTVDGRGTGYIGRKARCIIRGNLGYYEARDQIETAKIWAQKKYVDQSRIAIWGWSYGGFMTLKTLEQDGGETFQYGMAVAPVTDWRFYDSVYTERYMHTPQHNPSGYDNASISEVSNLQKNVRFLIMHGVADDNVHMQNTLSLIDSLDLASVENYDVHFFPDSDHSIYFHNANRMVYDRLKDWLINAFNGEWVRMENPVPVGRGSSWKS